MKYFKLLGLLFLFLISTVSFATADGLYVRAIAGISATSFDNRSQAPFAAPVNIDASATNFNAGMALGYGKKIKRFYLAAELRGLYDASESKINALNTPPATLRQKLQYTYSASLLPGYYLNPHFLLFVRLGLSGGMYLSEVTPSGNPNVGIPGRFTRHILGGVFGFGIQAFLTQQFALALEYNYSYYPKFTETRPVGLFTAEYEYKIQNNKGLLSLVYYFSKPPKELPPKVVPIHEALAVDNPKPAPYQPKDVPNRLTPRLSTYYETRSQKTSVAGLSEPDLKSEAFQPNHSPLPNPKSLGG